MDDLTSKDTLLDCGPLTVNFFYDDAMQTPLDPAFLLDDGSALGSKNFAVLYSTDVLKAGLHPITYTASFTNHP